MLGQSEVLRLHGRTCAWRGVFHSVLGGASQTQNVHRSDWTVETDGRKQGRTFTEMGQRVKDGVKSPGQPTVPRTHSDLGASRLRGQERLRLILSRSP